MNNLFDSLSGLVTLICLTALSGSTDISSKNYISKAEELFTFIISVIVGFTGLYFAYSSVERLIYPTAVSYRQKYLIILIATAAIKLFMFAVFRLLRKKCTSDILKVMAVDCILDFFVTAVTAMTLLISRYGTYSADAFCGIIISIVITVSAVKMIFSSCGKLIGYLPYKKREAFLNELFKELDRKDIENISFSLTGKKNEAFVFSGQHTDEEKLKEISKKTGITVYIISRKENTEKSVQNEV